ncbi:MAG: M2 family metallopeptidase [Myxococcales bacterium]|nr:M2 family metallopeptidase [Myxococcales bacterium]
MRTRTLAVIALALAPSLLACKSKSKPPAPTNGTGTRTATPVGPTVEEAQAFIADVDKGLREVWTVRDTADWERSTNITPETEARAALTAEAATAYLTRKIGEAKKFEGVVGKLDPATQRQFHLLRIAGQTAPADEQKAKALAEATTAMDSTYGKSKVCGAKGACQDLGQLTTIMAKSRKPAELLAAWQGWHDTTGRAVRPIYERFVPLANEGVAANGFADVSELWLSSYDMKPDDVVAMADTLWGQVEPLYKDLHCYTRRRLSKFYGPKVVPPTGPMPAHMLGNMWAQDWSNVYDLLEPNKGQASPDVSAALVKQKYDATRMAKLAESFFVSLGLPSLPATFWERSQLVQPKGKEVVCHASAWDPTYSGDARIKMCIKVNQEDLITLHHELGHDYYYLSYYKLPVLFQSGANDGFHEAIGDTIALSITPSYLKQIGLLDKVSVAPEAVINQQMFVALSKVAFLPFGLVVDKWRWEAFSGKITPEQWNQRWWELRQQYQGVAPAVARAATDFDPGAKYHVPSNTPYLRYFLSTILQFQFHRALCKAAGWDGPLHECSIYGSPGAGTKLAAMLALGASKPWPDALEAMTGQREIDATAMLDYFAPLHAWLKAQNAGQECGW